MRTSVVIAAYDLERFTELAAAVTALQAQTVPPCEIILAIDRNPELAKRASAELSSVTVVSNEQHPGAGGARNSGGAAATGDLLAFLDDDAVPAADWIERIEDSMTSDSVIGVGGFIEPWWLEEQPAWFPAEFGWVVGCSYIGLPMDRAQVRNVIAANMAISRAVFNALGGFRQDFGKQGSRSEPEETDLCIRAGQMWPERSWIYDPSIRVRHRVPSSRGRFGYFVRRCFNEGVGKAALAALVGKSDALSEESSYARKVLPKGIATGLGSFFAGRDAAGILRAAAIAIGLFVTAAAYAMTSLRARPATATRARAELRALPAVAFGPAEVIAGDLEDEVVPAAPARLAA